MTKVELKFHDYRYFPYEQRLAALEVERLLGAEPERLNGSLHVETRGEVDLQTLQRLTYFRDVLIFGEDSLTPHQARLEASATRHGDPEQLSRQQTRYSAHGLHEYRGKFNPQMVRVVTNLLEMNIGDRIWDPFCGSGTVLLEARHQGYSALGVDLNPLAVDIANAKLAAIGSDPELLQAATYEVAVRVRSKGRRIAEGIPDTETIADTVGQNWLERFPCPDYLLRWFPIPVLAQLAVILETIDEVVPLILRDVFRIVVSDVLRSVSWQDPGDLRVRRRKDPAPNYPATEVFVSALQSRVGAVLAAQKHISPRLAWQAAFLGDSGDVRSLDQSAQGFLEDGIQCILSSPPYATALPYIDTHRLSIALFGLATVQEIRQLDYSLVGSREIQTRERLSLEEAIENNKHDVAEEVWQVCRDLKRAYDPSSDGFRRQNTPAVVYRYFVGMTRVMAEAKGFLTKGGWLAFIVGPNRTSLGGVKHLIDTPALLAATGTHVGYELSAMYELNAYSRYDVHSRNSIREERLLLMQRV